MTNRIKIVDGTIAVNNSLQFKQHDLIQFHMQASPYK